MDCIIKKNERLQMTMTDEELDKYLEEELIREADIIERALLKNTEPETMSQEELDRIYKKIVASVDK